MNIKAVLLDHNSLRPEDLNFNGLIEALPLLKMYPSTNTQQLTLHIGEAEVVLSNKVELNAETLKRHTSIKLICVLATGMNNIDLEAAKSLGITVKNVRNYGSTSVAEHVFSLMLELARNTRHYLKAVNQGDWSRQSQFCLMDHPVEQLNGKTLGLIGTGVLGSAVATIAPAFGMNVIKAERQHSANTRKHYTPFNEVIQNADILSLHCPLTEENAQFINYATLAQMKPSAWLINTARGGLINEKDLLHALDNKIIAAAALDVLCVEPPPENHLLLQNPRPNLIITPHIAWAAVTARQTILDMTTENIRIFYS